MCAAEEGETMKHENSQGHMHKATRVHTYGAYPSIPKRNLIASLHNSFFALLASFHHPFVSLKCY